MEVDLESYVLKEVILFLEVVDSIKMVILEMLFNVEGVNCNKIVLYDVDVGDDGG